MIVANWNMQGASHSTENKWNEGVMNLLQTADVITLQESGGVPGSAKVIQENVNGIADLTLYYWGAERALKYILFYPWDANGNRCNLAVVSNIEPDLGNIYGLLYYPANGPTHRPVIGLLINNLWVFSIHAISGTGADAAGLVNEVAINLAGQDWTVSGDYNREPGTLLVNGVICPPNKNTYSVINPTKEIDYMVKSNAGNIIGAVSNLIMSDHYPVLYQL